MSKKFNRSQIDNLLKRSPIAVEVGIVRLWQLQTHDERQAGKTKHRNGVGFSGVHARRGSKLAGWLLGLDRRFRPIYNFKHLNHVRAPRILFISDPVDAALHITLKHSQQLTDIANGDIILVEDERINRCVRWIKEAR